MERETSSSDCNSKPRRYELPSNEVNGTSNNEHLDDDDDDAAGEYLEVTKKKCVCCKMSF